MEVIDIAYLKRCIQALEKALEYLLQSKKDDIHYDLYRSACIKEFEIIIEQAGKLLKKCLKPYFSSTKKADQLFFKDIFRHSAKHSIISLEECERWLNYRDNRNQTSHDYGIEFAEQTLKLLPQFILDANQLIIHIKRLNDNQGL
ncbi:MAG: nucleotidyltransferase substrate binding protein [Bacteroidota bacterium]